MQDESEQSHPLEPIASEWLENAAETVPGMLCCPELFEADDVRVDIGFPQKVVGILCSHPDLKVHACEI